MEKAQLNKAYFEAGDWLHTKYRGVPIFKYATDLYVYEEILNDTRPDLIIETGTLKGGSALWFRNHSHALIVTIDTEDDVRYREPGITYYTMSSLSLDLNTERFKRVMVVLDSDHSKTHVLAELKKYAPLVSKGCYLVIEDTFISQYLNNQDPNNDYSNGSSWEAVQEWDSKGFEVQPDKFTLSMNPGGWFKRV